ncbi:MAG: GlsB/YeaQ/YmgE family stress response membrane protein [Kofleriaceae bacterium]|nr:MAG: GlsB/YeaQ/YmgE family stress response membrane protein [Kofleriaceae bacterium]MBZ0238336.1 GlsB/YeaQ/YmgE family stress response membrane protein [Kofleriaceae bacterium]
MEILWMALVGLVVGALAKLIMPGRDPGGVIVTALIGLAGGLLAAVIGRAAGWYHQNEGAGFIASIIGAVLLLAIYRAVIARRGDLPG